MASYRIWFSPMKSPSKTERFVNKQNDRVCLLKRSAENLHLQFATRTQALTMVIVWAAVTADGHFPLVFIDLMVKITVEYYRENTWKIILKPYADKHFGGRPWTFQQDAKPPHSGCVNQEWLKEAIPRFISIAQWPPKSLDLNPLDFCAWCILESKVLTKKC